MLSSSLAQHISYILFSLKNIWFARIKRYTIRRRLRFGSRRDITEYIRQIFPSFYHLIHTLPHHLHLYHSKQILNPQFDTSIWTISYKSISYIMNRLKISLIIFLLKSQTYHKYIIQHRKL